MKALHAFVILSVLPIVGFAEQPPTYAKDGRIVTVEEWRRGGGIVWAVQKDRVVVYEVFSSAAPDRLLMEVPLSSERVMAIRDALAAIPKEVRGHVYSPRGVMDGLMLRISFTEDGRFANDRIEIRNVWLASLGDIIHAISVILPEDQRIRFKERIEQRNRILMWPADHPINVITVEEYYKEGRNFRFEVRQ